MDQWSDTMRMRKTSFKGELFALCPAYGGTLQIPPRGSILNLTAATMILMYYTNHCLPVVWNITITTLVPKADTTREGQI